GSGGGVYNSSGSGNLGISVGALLSGTTVTVTGIGGNGSGGGHHGVTISSTANANKMTFLNCSGGSNGYGVNFTSLLNLVGGILNFSNVAGGHSGTANYGIYIPLGITVGAATIVGSDIAGGRGTAQDYGLNLAGTLQANGVLNLTAASLGIGSNEYGIN